MVRAGTRCPLRRLSSKLWKAVHFAEGDTRSLRRWEYVPPSATFAHTLRPRCPPGRKRKPEGRGCLYFFQDWGTVNNFALLRLHWIFQRAFLLGQNVAQNRLIAWIESAIHLTNPAVTQSLVIAERASSGWRKKHSNYLIFGCVY